MLLIHFKQFPIGLQAVMIGNGVWEPTLQSLTVQHLMKYLFSKKILKKEQVAAIMATSKPVLANCPPRKAGQTHGCADHSPCSLYNPISAPIPRGGHRGDNPKTSILCEHVACDLSTAASWLSGSRPRWISTYGWSRNGIVQGAKGLVGTFMRLSYEERSRN